MSDESVLVIKFAGPGSAEFSIGLQNVTHNQVLLAASYLEMKAKSLILQAEAELAERTEEQKLMVPKPQILRK